MSFCYEFIKRIAKLLSAFYFKHVYVIGKENIPNEGPIILCGNHSNQFIDPMMILTNSPREISFCMAYTSLLKPLIGTIGKLMKVIPVYRPDDSKYQGTGFIRLISETEIEGIGTSFLLEANHCTKGANAIQVLRFNFQIINIVSNTKMIIRDNEKVYDEVKEKEHSFYFVPKMDNSSMFNEAYKLLNNDRAICIFPEGTSHDRTTFIKFKAGVAIMALDAMVNHSSKSIKIIPTGLSYFNRNEFRSEMLIEFGKAFEVPKEWIEMYSNKNKRHAVELLLNEIESRMQNVTLLCRSMKEQKCVYLVKDLYIPENITLNPDQYSELCKRFNKGYAKIIDDPDAKQMLTKTMNYMEKLKSCGIEDSEVKLMNFSYSWFMRKVILSLVLFHILIILHYPLIVIVCPFLFVIMKKVERERVMAIAKNPNKIEGLDIISSSRIQHFLMSLPIIFLMWLIFFLYYCNFYLRMNFGYMTIISLGTMIFPLYAYSTACVVDYITHYMVTIKTRFLYFCYPQNIDRLRLIREQLSIDLKHVIDKHIRNIDENYHQNRIIDTNTQNNKDNEAKMILTNLKDLNERKKDFIATKSIETIGKKSPNKRH